MKLVGKQALTKARDRLRELRDGSFDHAALRISLAARSPERTAPSIVPYDIVAVSVPAQ